MKRPLVPFLILLTLPGVAAAGEMYGTVKDEGKPAKEGLKVSVTCGAKSVAGATDKNGSYRVVMPEEGKCTLTVQVGSDSPSTSVHSYADSARYNLVIERKDGKATLRTE